MSLCPPVPSWIRVLRSGSVAFPSLLAALLTAPPGSALARPQDGDDAWGGPGARVDEFSGWFHNAGNLLLHMSNRGRFGRGGRDLNFPSGEWPAGSNAEYLWGAGIWIGGVIETGGRQDTLCSNGLFQNFEFRNFEPEEGCGNPREGICRSYEGASQGLRRFDDDGDGRIDEDRLDGVDNDGDGRVDEDFAGISQQMFATTYYDTSTFANGSFSDPAERHQPLGLRIDQESYTWTDPTFDDFVGIEFRVTNISPAIDQEGTGWDIQDAYIGFMVDSDVGLDSAEDTASDDHAAFAEIDTVTISPTGIVTPLHLTMGYMYDEPLDNNDDVPGYLGVLFLGHTVDTLAATPEEAVAPAEVGIHAFKIFSNGAEDPRDDLDRYRFLRGRDHTVTTIDNNTVRPRDYRFLVSAGPFAKIAPGSTLTFQVAFVAGDMVAGIHPTTGEPGRVPDLANAIEAQRVYDGFFDEATGEIVHWATSSPPPPPIIQVTPGDHAVVVEWDDSPEHKPDPLTKAIDFAGYQIWKAEGWRRESNVPSDDMWRVIADVSRSELPDVDTGHFGVGQYRFVDNRVANGFWYWYAVSAYDEGTFRNEIDFTVFPPETTRVQTSEPKYGKFSQNMVRVMPRTTATQTLADVYVVPNPYRETAAWDLAENQVEPTGRRVKFFNVPDRATVRIFSLAGDLVATLDEMEPTADRQLSWNLISRNNQDTVSGIYLYHVTSPQGEEVVGKFAVIR
ncbi:MAG: hypothetical protein DHS20C21_23880 [Gemmatimonadota bacterium]|nr:MAG: hypothetical protein DHS20C21_23880 [Gemmatimonadota bacterium]